jgi:hypothetical protein
MQDAGRKRRTEALDYMQSMLGELRTMAKAERQDMLGYLIEMAYLEASDIARGDRPAVGDATGTGERSDGEQG